MQHAQPSNDLRHPSQSSIYIISPDSQSQHMQELTKQLAQVPVNIKIQAETKSLGIPIQERIFVIVDNCKGVVTLGSQFTSLLMFIVGYPKKGKNKKNHYCQTPKSVLDIYNYFCSLPKYQKKIYNCSPHVSRSSIDTKRSISLCTSNNFSTKRSMILKQKASQINLDPQSKLFLYAKSSDKNFVKTVLRIAADNPIRHKAIQNIKELVKSIQACGSKNNYIVIDEGYMGEICHRKRSHLKCVIHCHLDSKIEKFPINSILTNEKDLIQCLKDIGFQVTDAEQRNSDRNKQNYSHSQIDSNFTIKNQRSTQLQGVQSSQNTQQDKGYSSYKNTIQYNNSIIECSLQKIKVQQSNKIPKKVRRIYSHSFLSQRKTQKSCQRIGKSPRSSDDLTIKKAIGNKKLRQNEYVLRPQIRKVRIKSTEPAFYHMNTTNNLRSNRKLVVGKELATHRILQNKPISSQQYYATNSNMDSKNTYKGPFFQTYAQTSTAETNNQHTQDLKIQSNFPSSTHNKYFLSFQGTFGLSPKTTKNPNMYKIIWETNNFQTQYCKSELDNKIDEDKDICEFQDIKDLQQICQSYYEDWQQRAKNYQLDILKFIYLFDESNLLSKIDTIRRKLVNKINNSVQNYDHVPDWKMFIFILPKTGVKPDFVKVVDHTISNQQTRKMLQKNRQIEIKPIYISDYYDYTEQIMRCVQYS